MPGNATGTNGGSFANTVPYPLDTEDVDGPSVQQVAEASANQDKLLFDRLTLAATFTPTISANHQIDTKIGIVYCRTPAANNTDWNLAMPAPTDGHPFIMFKFSGGTGTGRRVWLTDTANLAVAAPTDYFTYWAASTDAVAGCIMWYDGTLWRVISSYGMSGTTGGGSLADV
jgi:hypothetical protein